MAVCSFVVHMVGVIHVNDRFLCLQITQIRFHFENLYTYLLVFKIMISNCFPEPQESQCQDDDDDDKTKPYLAWGHIELVS